MAEQQTKELFNTHIVTNDARTIFASGRNFLEVFDKGAEIEGAFLVTAYWFHREIPVWIAALDRLYADYEFHDGQRVDLAIKYLRAQGVQCPEFTNYLYSRRQANERIYSGRKSQAAQVGAAKD